MDKKKKRWKLCKGDEIKEKEVSETEGIKERKREEPDILLSLRGCQSCTEQWWDCNAVKRVLSNTPKHMHMQANKYRL